MGRLRVRAAGEGRCRRRRRRVWCVVGAPASQLAPADTLATPESARCRAAVLRGRSARPPQVARQIALSAAPDGDSDDDDVDRAVRAALHAGPGPDAGER